MTQMDEGKHRKSNKVRVIIEARARRFPGSLTRWRTSPKHVSGVDPAVRQTKPIVTARVKDLSTNDAEHAGDALTRKVMQSMQEMHSRGK